MEAILVALITAVAAVIVAFLNRRKLNEVDRKLSTNHGKDAYEYLEMVAEVKDVVADIKLGQADLKEAFIEHTGQDATNFKELKDLIATKQDKA